MPQERISEIIINKLEKSERCSEKEAQSGTSLLIEETRSITAFLQKTFSKDKINDLYIPEIFESILSKLSRNRNSKLLKKAVFIFLDYIKHEFYFKSSCLSDDAIKDITNNILIRKYVEEYISESIDIIYEKKCDPFNEISYIQYLIGIGGDYNLFDDITKNNLEGIKGLVDKKLASISKNGDQYSIDDFCILLNTLNQLTTLQNINSEDKHIAQELYNQILKPKSEKAIIEYIKHINPCLAEEIKSGNDKKIIFSEVVKGKIPEDQLKNLNTLQNILGKFYQFFEANHEYISTGDIKNSEVIDSKIGEYIQNTIYGSELREHSNYGNKSSEEYESIKKRSDLITKGNIAYIKLIWIKKLSELDLISRQHLLIKNNCIDDLIGIYSEISATGQKFETEAEVIEDFVNLKNPQYFQIIIIWKLSLFCDDLKQETYIKLIKYLTSTNGASNTLYEKFKIKTLETLTEKTISLVERKSGKLNICKNEICDKESGSCEKVCHKVISAIESYVAKTSKNNMVFNYGKLYLSLSHLYSMGTGSKSFENAMNCFNLFESKYGMRSLPIELTGIVNKIKKNIADYELSKIQEEGGERVIMQNKKLFSMQEHENLQRGISNLTLKIQENDVEIMQKGSEEAIRKEICKIISKTLFNNNLSDITIEDRGVRPVIGRNENISAIENEYFDIVFKYSNTYEHSFFYIFNQEKDYIKEQVLQLIDIYKNYSEVYQLFETVMKLVSESFEKKHPYTAGHIDRVKHFSMITGKMLGMNHLELKVLEAQAMMHDYGKDFIPEAILKKTGKYTEEERRIMSEHPGIGIRQVINNNYNPRLMEGMPHHCNYYSPEGNKDYTLEKGRDDIKTGKKIDPSYFNKLLGRNIPLPARIIEIWDIVDAVASRRIYDERSGWTINEMISFILKELLKCSGLSYDKNGTLIPDPDKWVEVSNYSESFPYTFEYNDKFYLPNEDVTIQLDPHIVLNLFSNQINLDSIISELTKKDVGNIKLKLKEFRENIKILEEKKRRFAAIKKKLPKDFDFNLIPYYVFNEDDEDDLRRLQANLPKLLAVLKGYSGNKLNI